MLELDLLIRYYCHVIYLISILLLFLFFTRLYSDNFFPLLLWYFLCCFAFSWLQDQRGVPMYTPNAADRTEPTDNMSRTIHDVNHSEMKNLLRNSQVQQPFNNDSSQGFSFGSNRLAWCISFHLAVSIFFISLYVAIHLVFSSDMMNLIFRYHLINCILFNLDAKLLNPKGLVSYFFL